MLLHRGRLGDNEVLRPESVDLLLSRQGSATAAPGPEVPSMALAFHEVWFNGARLFGISGDTAAFHSELEVDPSRGLVLFLCYNISGHPGPRNEPSKLTTYARGELIHGIFDRYQPFHPKVVNLDPNLEEQRLARGSWIPANEIGLPAAQTHLFHSSIDADTHSLRIDRFLSDRDTVKRWALLRPHLWQQYPQDRIEAVAGRNGLPDRLVLAADPSNDLVRVVPQNSSSTPR